MVAYFYVYCYCYFAYFGGFAYFILFYFFAYLHRQALKSQQMWLMMVESFINSFQYLFVSRHILATLFQRWGEGLNSKRFILLLAQT